jgi:hypothetical protein
MTRNLRDSVRQRAEAPWFAFCLAAVLAGLLAIPSPAGAQMVMNSIDHLTFDRPESWALKYFSTASLLSGLETPRTLKPGTVSLGVEFGGLPPLSAAEQLVGYDGTEPQDLNKAPFFIRPRVSIALPASLTVTVAFVPPVRMFGIKPRLFAVAIERPVYEGRSWTVGLRGYGQVGSVEGSYTCPESTLAFASGSPGNVEGCEAASSDVASLRYLGGEVSAAYGSETLHRFSPHAAFGINYMNVAFQVNALTYGMIDHTRYLSNGATVSGSAGVSYRLTGRLGLGVDVFYSPLWITRHPGLPTINDGLFNVRALVTYRLH